MKAIWKAIAYFVLYFGLTIEFANNNILGITVISGVLTVLVLYLVFKFQKNKLSKNGN